MIKVAVSGASGRMGQMILNAVAKADDIELGAALDRADSPLIGKDAGEVTGKATGVIVSADPACIEGCDVLIDYTRPEATLSYLPVCAEKRVAAMIGTTGFDEAGKKAISATAEAVPVILAANTSVGVNAVLSLVAEAARLLAGTDVEIVEMHHRNKIDAPSGTALEMGRAIAKARGQNFDDVAILSREGRTGARPDNAIGFAALRGGDVVGVHTVIFAGTGERVEISHHSTSREGYAQGALTAARYLAKQEKGLYSMNDVLGISKK